MTRTRSERQSPSSSAVESEDRIQNQNPSGSATAMRLIVPLQGVVQGRGGLLLGSLIPCALFYFLQLYLKRNRSSKNSSNPPSISPSASSSKLTDLPRSSSRSSLSSRGSIGRVRVSSLARNIAEPDRSPYYIGLERVSQDPYDRLENPDGIIQLGLSDNKVWIIDC